MMATPNDSPQSRLAAIASSEQFKEFLAWLEKNHPSPEENVTQLLDSIPHAQFGQLLIEYSELLGMDIIYLLRSLQGNLLLRKAIRARQGLGNGSPLGGDRVVANSGGLHQPLTPELEAWAALLSPDEEIEAGLREIREQGGADIGDLIRELEETLASERTNR